MEIIYRTRKTVVTDKYLYFEAWANRVKGWKYNDDLGLFVRKTYDGSDYCLGLRYAGDSSWCIEDGKYWRGSYYFIKDDNKTDMNWHGGPNFYDIFDVLKWVRDAEYSELGCELWSAGKGDKPYKSEVL